MRVAVSFIALMLSGAAMPAAAETFEEAMALAMANNPDLEDARLGVQAARLDRSQARAGYLPSVGVYANYGAQDIETRTNVGGTEIVNNDRYNPASAGVRLSQDVYTGGRRRGALRVAEAGMDSAEHALRATEQDVLLSAAEAYLRVYAQEQILRVREAQVASLEREVAATQRRLEIGEVSRTDLLQVRTRLAGARADAARAQADLDAARARYEQVVGVPPQTLAPAPPAPRAPADLREAVARAADAHPDVLEGRAQVEAARGQATIERSALLPQVSIVGSYDRYEDDDFVDREREGSTAEARLSVPLYQAGAAARARQGRVNVERAQAQLEATQRATVARVSAAWSQARAAHSVVEVAREQVEASEQALAGAERERGLGLRTTIDVLNAQQEWRDAEAELARAQAQDILAGYALLAAMGELTRDDVSGGH